MVTEVMAGGEYLQNGIVRIDRTLTTTSNSTRFVDCEHNLSRLYPKVKVYNLKPGLAVITSSCSPYEGPLTML